MHASSYDGTESKKYHGLLIYNEENFGTNVDEEPLLSRIVATTQQTVTGGECSVLLDYEDNMIITMVDHTLGPQMIDECQTTDARERAYKIIQRLNLMTNNMGQPLSTHAEMLEFREILRVISKKNCRHCCSPRCQ